MRADRLAGWVPIRVYWERATPLVDWCYLGERRFTEPFFNETIELCLRRPANLLFRHQTTIEALKELSEARPGVRPSGFIFHMSRCGSTLVAQMLASLDSSIVLSEAEPIDSVLRANFRDPDLSDDRRAEWLRWMVSALGQQRRGEEKHLFIKFDCWDTIELELINRAFPDVPWIFLYRNPLEVMISQYRRRSAHLIPGIIEPALFGLGPSDALSLRPEDYSAIILSRICEAALRHKDTGRSFFLDYSRLPAAVWTSILDFFHVAYAPEDLERLQFAARFNSKNPSVAFEGDRASISSHAAEELIEATDRWLAPIYGRLKEAEHDTAKRSL